ncbi:UMF1 family MFS transporter [Amycolatopsis lexingtonensis]|uniref:UMF1 family MFS transporter n=1 Tax=Amycolatopsis lexingtonensis TaxID=218822 RepID=A0ABR9HT14_9PSEU|nr:MFS transporter [Amycolatopsis lexingtonensis]MBE1494065.1 UMF1 family MFS transporter [Amycolatopsis lexingtonensis]
MATVDETGHDAVRRREQRGWVWYDWANSVFPTSVTTVFGALYLTAVAAEAARRDTALNGPNPCPADAEGNRDKLHDCAIGLFGLHFPAGSLWGYLLSAATVIQVLVLPVMGAIADRTRAKRRMLAVFAFGGAAATTAMAFVAGTDWQLGVVLFVLGNIGYGTSVVIYYSFLPEIATADERDGVSTRGWAFGYLGGGLALALQLAVYVFHDSLGLSTANSAQIAFATSGLWWALFTLIPLRALRGRAAPPSPRGGGWVVTAGFRELGRTLRAAKAFPLTLAFLGTYLVYTDGISTVANVSAQYGSEQLRFSDTVLITTILVVQFVAFAGGMLHGLVAKRLGAKKTIMVSLGIWVLVVASAYFVQAGQLVQYLLLAAGIGLVLGGTNALSRSLFSQMVPPGREAQYFSVYEVGERATSWLGPLLFAGMAQATGSYRYAIISLVVFFVAGLVLMSLVPVRRAIRAVGNEEPAVL